jgi:hypothetical protein
MSPSPLLRFVLLPGLALVFVAGCGTTYRCSDDTDYLQARDRPRLQLPEGVTGSERLGGGMVIPPPVTDSAKLDPAPKCLDEPPQFFARKPGAAPKTAAASGSPEETVNVWATAWAGRKADQVAAFYSPQFQTVAPGGAAAFIADRRQEVASGAAPSARLDDLKATPSGTDRSVVTFTQRFGDEVVRKELTLAREPTGWRIVAERTL